MATEGRAVFLTAELDMVGGTTLATAPLYPELAWLGDSGPSVAMAFENAAEKRWSRKGELLGWLESVGGLELVPERFELTFPASREPLQPELCLQFDILLGERMALAPALGIGAWAEDTDGARTALEANIKLEFARRKRLRSGRGVLATQWYTELRAHPHEISASFYTFHELRTLAEEGRERLLPKVATEVWIRRQHTFGMAERVADLERILSSRSGSSLLLVGPSGVGKTALIEELCRTGRREVWETTASRLERALTGEGGWQDNLTALCSELEERKAHLFVRNLAELFEVGRYVGNDTSIGEYLRPFLASGRIALFTECTDAQRARLDARAPGYLGLFREVRVAEPEPEAMERIVVQRARAVSGGRLGVDAVQAILSLQRRFAPYSGYPGKAIRFTEHLARAVDGPLGPDVAVRRFCAESGIPQMMIDPDVDLPIERIRRHFTDRILGQEPAIEAVVDTLVRVKAAATRGGRPIASLLFAGPTGVGKTETAKALASFLFGSPDRLVRFDMSEYSSPAAVLRLVGGSGEGALTAAVRRQPFGVLLFDEIEKADPSFFDLLLQVLGEGRLTDGRGHVADFCSSVIVMTSNLGASSAARQSGFGRKASTADLTAAYRDAVRAWFRPELFNRIDRVLPFAPLSHASIRAVLDLKLAEVRQRAGLQAAHVTLELTEAARDHLARVGTHPSWGARHLHRAISDLVLGPAAALVNVHTSGRPLRIRVEEGDGALQLTSEQVEEDAERLAAGRSLAELADRASEARRLGARVTYGGAFAELRSSWAILERRRRRKGDAFWRDDRDARRHGRLADVLDGCRTVLAEVDTLEEELSLAAILGSTDPVGRLAEAFSELETRRNEVFRRLYAILNADQPPLCLGIYGDAQRVDEHAALYASIAEKLSFDVTRWEVWLRRHPTDELVARSPRAERTPDLLKQVGVELEITGPGAVLALGREQGLLVLTAPGTETRLRLVGTSCAHAEFARPDDVHRKKAFDKGRILRRFGPDLVEDGHWSRGVPPARYAEALTTRLCAQFWEALVQEVSS